jgi:methyl-accepting chemotaxis protein
MIRLRDLTLRQKAMGMAAGATATLLVISGAGLYLVDQMARDVEALARRDVPGSLMVTQLSMQQSEQLVDLEKAARYGTNMQAEEDLGLSKATETKRYAKAARDFRADLGGVLERIGKLRDKFEAARSVPGIEDAEIDKLLAMLAGVESAQKQLNTAGKAMMGAIEGHDWAAFPDRLAALNSARQQAKTKMNLLFARVQLNLRKKINDAVETERSGTWILGGATAAAIALSLLMSWLFARLLSRPIARAVAGVEALAQGDTSVRISSGGRDEVGRLARSVEDLRQAQERLREMEAQQARDQRARERSLLEQDQLVGITSESVAGMLDQVSDATTKVAEIVEQSVGALESAKASVETANSEAQEAAYRQRELASATEQMASSIQEINRKVADASDKSDDALQQAEETARKVRSLREAADEIGQVVSLIEDIAEQTNLLALNATIEASRAGEAGKGFAVVAQEVKNLANQTGKATQQITENIQRIQSQTYDSADAIDAIRTRIGALSEMASSVASAMQEQESTTQEQSRNIQEASSYLDSVTERIAAARDQVGDSQDQLNAARDRSQGLRSESDELGDEIGTFVGEMRREDESHGRIYEVGAPATLSDREGRPVEGRLLRLGPGRGVVTPQLGVRAGAELTLHSPALSQPVTVRSLGDGAEGTEIQPELTLDTEELIDRDLGRAAA